MTTVNIYLTFDGECKQAFDYYKSIFGGDFDFISTFAEMPPQDGITIPDEMKDRIMHVSLPISEGYTLMGSDTGGEWAPKHVVGNNFSISVNADTKEKAEQFFNALADGGNITMPLGKTFWSDCYGMLTDKFGISWMVSCD